MTTATANGVAQATAKVERGFGELTCPCCGQDCGIQLNLSDLDTCSCPECSEEFSLDTVREMLAKWQRVLAWVDACPAE